MGAARKIVCIVGFVLFLAALMPVAVPGQNIESVDQVRLSELERRADRLDGLPERTAVIEDSVHNIKEQIDALSTRAWLILAAAGAALFDRLLGVFGVKIRDRDGPG